MAIILSVLLTTLLDLTTASKCALQTSKVPVSSNNPDGTYPNQIEVDYPDFNDTAIFNTGSVFTVTCEEEGYTFTNGIREIIGVDVARINTEGKIIVKCDDQYFVPNIWVQTEGPTATATSYRQVYCVPGCAPITDNTLVIHYNQASVSFEDYSPPILPNPNFVSTVSCKTGYTTAAIPSGATQLSCVSAGKGAEWRPAPGELLKCYKGCQDIRNSVQFGSAMASPNNQGASFTVGSEIEFKCESGFELVGWKVLTCNANSVWSEELPECVYLGAGIKRVLSGVVLTAHFVFVISLL